jgi:hypothetical protein
MITARDRLKSISDIKEIYTEAEIPETGKNFITEKNRITGADTYTFYIQLYALKLLVHRAGKVLSDNNGVDTEQIYRDDSDIKQWSHARTILENEGLKEIPLKESLEKVINMNNVFLSSVYSSKDKDNIRGKKIISDYSAYHKPAGEDLFIIELKNRTVIDQTRLEQILQML